MTERKLRSDVSLWQQAAFHSDSRAYLALFERVAPRVIAYTFERTSDWLQAQTAAVVTFVETWRRRGQLASSGPMPVPLILGVATEVIRAGLHRAKKNRPLVDALAKGSNQPANLESAVTTAREVGAAVDQLPATVRDLVWLRLQGLNVQETADALRMPAEKVRGLLARGGVAVNGRPFLGSLPDASIDVMRQALEQELSVGRR